MSGYFCGTFDWKELRGSFVVPPGTAAVALEAGLSYARGTAWFASIRVQEVPLPYSPREDASAIVSVDTETLNPLPVLGVGWNWAYVFERDSEMRMPRERIDQLLRYAAWDQQSFVRFGTNRIGGTRAGSTRTISVPTGGRWISGSAFRE